MVVPLIVKLLMLMQIGHGFVLQGNWKLVHNMDYLPTIVFQVKKDEIKTRTDNAAMRFSGIDWKLQGNLIELDIGEIDIVKYPKDWYNFAKYKRYLTIFGDAKKYGIKAMIDIEDDNNLTITARIGSHYSTGSPFLLERVPYLHHDIL